MHGILYEESSIWQFLLVTCVIGGWLAWMTGRATARSWGTYVQVVAYVLLLGCALRFIHYALFEGTLLTVQYYVVDTVVLLVLAVLGFRYTRTGQMTGQYNWLYERTSALSYQRRDAHSPSVDTTP